jgi:arginyl-tRNA synthetase
MEKKLAKQTASVINRLYKQNLSESDITVQKTRPDVAGDYTILVFPLMRYSKKKPEETASRLGETLESEVDFISGWNVIKGFLNVTLSDDYWKEFLKANANKSDFGFTYPTENSPVAVVEYSSPNTNKPLHLGHIRNNLLGYAVSNILKVNGQQVKKVNLVNDRGIHICKSMLAWQKWSGGETPEQAGIKGDHLIGKYYVAFDKAYQEEVDTLVKQGMDNEQAKKEAPLMREAQAMLKDWESGKPEVVALWKMMNQWAYDGFDVTYQRMGVDFDKVYYESDTYLLGKDIVKQGLESGLLFEKENGSVWADLSDEGLDEKLLLRADGTSVYMTQDLGTAVLRYEDFHPDKLIYVVGNEQNYHFDVLRRILKKLGYSWSDAIHHLSYGMVELPEGKMKSREGKVVDADDLMDEMVAAAKESSMELGKLDEMTGEEAEKLFQMIGLGALKYFILKVDPKKTMTFNPKESIDLNGNTGPFIQYTHARIRSVLRKAKAAGFAPAIYGSFPLTEKEKILIKRLHEFPAIIKQAGGQYNPAMVANYIYELAREYNQFYHDLSILKAEGDTLVAFRLELSRFTGDIIRRGMALLGINVPEVM